MINKLKGYRTVVFNALVLIPPMIDAVLPFVAEVAGMAEVQALIPADRLPMYLMAVSIVNIYLRSITDTPVGRR